MFSGRHKLTKHNGRIFIDRDGDVFCMIINYLRTGKVPLFESKYKEIAFYEELDFWQIPLNLYRNENESNIEQFFDQNWCAHTLSLDLNSKIVRKNDPHHGIVFCSQPLDLYNPYVEFRVKIEAVFRGKSHLFVGLVDKNKQRKEYLSK